MKTREIMIGYHTNVERRRRGALTSIEGLRLGDPPQEGGAKASNA